VACLALALPAVAGAAPGSVDRSFGDDGFVDLTRAPAERFPNLSNAFAMDMKTGPGGAIFVLSVGDECGPECRRVMIVTRYRPDGSVDAGYGEGGSALSRLGDAGKGREGLLAVDSRGRASIAVANGSTVEIVRLTTDGRRDASFGDRGEVALAGVSSAYAHNRLLLTPSGGALVESDWTAPRPPGGHGSNGSTAVVSIAKLRADGAPDRAFGGDGSRKIRLLHSLPPQAVAVQPGGAATLVGSPCCPHRGRLPYVVRIRADGSLDRRFGPVSGLRSLSRAESIEASEILVRPSGRIDIAGSVRWGKPGHAARTGGFLIRLRGDGTPYRRFGADGARLDPWAFDAAALDADGRVLGVTAPANPAPPTTAAEALTVFRLTAGGGVDRSFGGGRGVHVPGASRGEGRIAAAYSGPRPVVFNERSFICRESCPSEPVLVGLAGGPPVRPVVGRVR
jgi:uncharacterized delta-60 repeat protein